ncbi:MAG: hypothetical protein DBY41_07465 [Clostridium sp.]|nr:MAG: hypothetical protein DBY41_07465 [Clostridium sp.]
MNFKAIREKEQIGLLIKKEQPNISYRIKRPTSILIYVFFRNFNCSLFYQNICIKVIKVCHNLLCYKLIFFLNL